MKLIHELSSLASQSSVASYINLQRPPCLPQNSLPIFKNKNSTYCPVLCIASPTKIISDEKNVVRRNANYQAPFWPAEYMHSLRSDYSVCFFFILYFFIFNIFSFWTFMLQHRKNIYADTKILRTPL